MELEIENIRWLVENDGEISIGRFGPSKCAAIASIDGNMIAALEKKKNEPLEDLLTRFDTAINQALEDQVYIDEINN